VAFCGTFCHQKVPKEKYTKRKNVTLYIKIIFNTKRADFRETKIRPFVYFIKF